MDALQNLAYDNPNGYAVGYVKDAKILFIAGSRNIQDWTLNTIGLMPKTSPLKMIERITTKKTKKKFERLYQVHQPHVVVGHSRGGLFVAEMSIPNFQKLGLNAALRLTGKENRRTMMNIHQQHLFDKFIRGRKAENSRGYSLKFNKSKGIVPGIRDYAGRFHYMTKHDPSRLTSSSDTPMATQKKRTLHTWKKNAKQITRRMKRRRIS
jgi:hypothetical protein